VHQTEAFPISTSYQLTHDYMGAVEKEAKTKSEIGSWGVHQM